MDLKISTSRAVLIGPFIDETDGKTRQTGLSLVASDCRISKNGANVATPTLSGSITHAFQGHYYLTFATGDVDTNGTLELVVYKSGSLPVFHNFDVLPAASWDVLHGSSIFDVNMTKVAGSNVSATSGLLDANITKIGGTTAPQTSGVLDVNTTKIGGTTAPATAGVLDVNMTKVNGTAVLATAGLLDANITKIGSNVAPQSSGVLEVNLTKIGGQAYDGGAWELVGKRLHLSNNAGPGFKAEATSGNNAGAIFTGSGSKAGIHATGGATGEGILSEGNTEGIHARSLTSGNGIKATGTGTDKSGIYSTAANGHGMELVGNGTDKKDLYADEIIDIGNNIVTVNNNVLSIQNNTKFTCSIPVELVIPESPAVRWAKISVQVRDETGNPEDPDSNEIAIKNVCDQTGAVHDEFYFDNGAVTPAPLSSTFTPDFYKLNRISTGIYEVYWRLTGTDDLGSHTFTFRYNEGSILQEYSRSLTVIEEEAVTNIELVDNATNRTIIAKAMKSENVSSVTAVTGSVYKALLDQINVITAKLPSGNISDFSLLTIQEGETFGNMLSMLMAMFNGNYSIDPAEGLITFYKRDNTTPLSIVKVTTTTRERQSLPS